LVAFSLSLSTSFAFTLLDEENPDRRFEFTLATTEDEEDSADGSGASSSINNDKEQGGSYMLVDCDPILRHRENNELKALVQSLNETDDVSDFIRALRQMFADALAANKSDTARG
jgi:Chromosome segregation protein Spc25